ncbi:BTB/POZ domain-containing protein [Iris pallida]|uniref:BTB/POZ domain-containing protein n=1 Tax=Iris pallida TaxID=29817 RepID=A0AAX6HGB5_IRIPA|nr:BTB/POZ domain-containing protein [Iris pallida]
MANLASRSASRAKAQQPCAIFDRVQFFSIWLGAGLFWSRSYATKDVRFRVEARVSMLKGVEDLVDTV